MNDILTLDGGLNSDIDVHVLPKGDTPVTQTSYGRMNMFMDKYGSYRPMNGDTHIFGLSTFDGFRGYIEDIEEDRVLFLYGSGNLINVYELDNTDTVTNIGEVYLQNIIGEVKNLVLIGSGTNKMLGWCDSNNEPTLFRLRYLSLPYDLGFELNGADSKLIRQPAIIRMVITYAYDADIKVNTIKQRTYQFAERCIYADGKESVWSMYSPTMYYENELINGVIHDQYNYIQLSIYQQSKAHEKTDIAYRYTDTETGVPSSWYLYDTITLVSYPETVVFVDNKYKEVIDGDEMLILADNVPVKCEYMAVINGNRIILGDPTLGYDNVDIDVNFGILYSDSENQDDFIVLSEDQTVDESNYDFNLNAYAADAPFTFSILLRSVSGNNQQNPDYFQFTFTGDKDISYFICDYINDNKNHTSVTISRLGVNSIRFAGGVGDNPVVNVQVTGINPVKRYKTLKDGVKHYVALQYEYQGGRKTMAQISTDTDIEIPFITKDADIMINMTSWQMNSLVSGIKFQINHVAPVGALRWQWLYGGSNVTNWYQIPIVCRNLDDTQEDVTVDGVRIKINVVQADTRMTDAYPQYNSLISFDAKKGDYVRVKAYYGYQPIYDSNRGSLTQSYLNFEIIDVEEDGTIVIENSTYDEEINDLIGVGSYEIVLIEVYRVNKDIDSDSIIYKEIGQSNSITTRYHQYSNPISNPSEWYEHGRAIPSQNLSNITRNQTASLPCIGIIDIWDSYFYMFDPFILTNTAVKSDYFVPHINITNKHSSLLYNSKRIDGKINYVDKDAKQRKYNAIVWGGLLSKEGLIYDNLNKFNESDILMINEQYGTIQALLEEGNILTVVQERACSSIGINASLVTNLDGTETLSVSDNVLSFLYKYKETYGTLFWKSIQKIKDKIYLYDIYNGEVVRKSSNGLRSISGINDDGSNYFMKRFFKERSNLLLASGISNISCCGGFDKLNNLYYLTCKDSIDSSNNFTAVFSEERNRWVTFCEFYPFRYFNRGLSMYYEYFLGAYIETGINKMYSNSSLILGSLRPESTQPAATYAYFDLVSAPEGDLNKVYEAIRLNADDIWEAYDDDSVITGEDFISYTDTDNYAVRTPKAQSRIRSEDFKYKDGYFEASFNRNMITNQDTPDIYDLINGNKIIGKYLKIRLRNNNILSRIRNVLIRYKLLRGQ